MRPIDIQINQAKILSFAVDLKDDDTPDIAATVGLYCGENKISSFRLCTQTYYSESISFNLPTDMIQPIIDISKQLEVVLVRECNKQLKRLPAIDALSKGE